MQNMEVMDVIYVKFMSNIRRAQRALSPCMSEITCRITSEKNLQAKITSRVTSMQNLRVTDRIIFTHLKFTSESHPKSHPCRIHSLPGLRQFSRVGYLTFSEGSDSGGLFDRWAGFWRSWTNRVALFKNIEVDYLLRAAHHTP